MSAIVFAGRRNTEPMRGGLSPSDAIRGLTDRGFLTWLIYRSLARGDFHHDFGERTAARDLIMASDAARFFEIAKLVSTKGKVWLMTQFAKYTGQTLYSLLGPRFDTGLVPPSMEPEAYNTDTDKVSIDKDEIGLLRMLGIEYEQIKVATKASGQDPLNLTFKLPNNLGERSYVVRSSSYRLGERVAGVKTAESQTNRNIATMFQEVTGGEATKFALIVDATGGLSLSELLNSNLNPPSTPGCQFYIIENIENSSDSADKVKHIKRRGNAVTQLFFLRDETNTVTYPLWNNSTDPKSNIFAKMNIVLNRMPDGTVEAIIDADGETFHIGDVANASNVKNATLKALSILIEKGMVPEVFVYTLIKRMGDWCQALSLLDMDRIYNIINYDGPAPEKNTTTLGEMIGDSAEVGVVTNDRILLAFCILHGLNVFFTSAMDLARLIYFKNRNDLPSPEKVHARLNTIVTETSAKLADIKIKLSDAGALIQGNIATAMNTVISSTDLPSYIRNLKNFITNASKLTDITFEESTAAVNASQAAASAAVEAGAPPAAALGAANQFSSEVAKLKVSLDNAERIIGNLATGSYAGKTVVDIRTQALGRRLAQGGRNTKSVEVVEARDILLDIRSDVQLMIQNGIIGSEELTRLLNPINPGVIGQVLDPTGNLVDGRGKVNNDEVLSALVPIRLLIPAAPPAAVLTGGQRGGNLDIVFNALRTRKILLLPPGYPEATSTPNAYVQGDDYVDDKLRAYSVVDEYIVTMEDAPTFAEFFNYDKSQLTNREQAGYICVRYVLLEVDKLQQRYEQFRDTFHETDTGAVEDGIIVESTQLYDGDSSLRADLQAVYHVINNLRERGFESAKAYHDGDDSAVIRSPVADIKAAIAECKRKLFAWFPAAPLTVPAENEQKLFGLSEYCENIVLSTAAARLATTESRVTEIVDGAQVLNKKGLLLQTAIRDAVANQDEAVPIDPAAVNSRVATALTTWLGEQGIPSGPLMYEINQRLASAQRGQGRKTHRRRRLPKLI